MSLPDAGQRTLNTLLNFDIEVWCGSWKNLDGRFPAAFSRYIYGSSRAGNYALPKILEILNTYGLKGVFFVEPLFATRFGLDPLAEIVGLIQDAGQEVQLHLHPEWQDEAREPLIVTHASKRQHLFLYDADEQSALIDHGLRLLKEAGAAPITAFRAGSFACNAETFTALERNGIQYDSSLNITMDHSGQGLPPEIRCQGIHHIGRTVELPVSVFRTPTGSLRHMQVGACAYTEIVQALSSARVNGWSHCNIFSHNCEMLLPGSSQPDWTVVRRFEKLCQHLHDHRDNYPTLNFATGLFAEEAAGLALPTTSATTCLVRNIEQGYRRVQETLYHLRHHEAAG
jgi:hypothetical protein